LPESRVPSSPVSIISSILAPHPLVESSSAAVPWAPILLVSAGVADTIAQGIWTYYAQVLHQPTLFPSLDDVAYLSYYPLVLRALRPVIVLIAAGLVATIIADSIFDYQTLHGTYQTGNLIDLGWPLGDMLVCLAGSILLSMQPAHRTAY
jgi:hypothetical protein